MILKCEGLWCTPNLEEFMVRLQEVCLEQRGASGRCPCSQQRDGLWNAMAVSDRRGAGAFWRGAGGAVLGVRHRGGFWFCPAAPGPGPHCAAPARRGRHGAASESAGTAREPGGGESDNPGGTLITGGNSITGNKGTQREPQLCVPHSPYPAGCRDLGLTVMNPQHRGVFECFILKYIYKTRWKGWSWHRVGFKTWNFNLPNLLQ